MGYCTSKHPLKGRIIRYTEPLLNWRFSFRYAVCLILFAVEPNPEYRLIVAANRDEFYSRVAEPAELWPDESGVLGGRDKGMGGTWLGINHNGRFAAVTNFKEEPPQPLPPLSRG
ncbi:MAG: NRDE family protein, partial [Pseudomonadales bacterium]|nr:NRDE family protein [Pseudomonadales bacterium]